MSFDNGANELLLEPPEGFQNKWNGTTTIDISSDIWRSFPRDSAVAQKILNGAWFSHYGLSAELHTPPRPTFLTVNLPTWWESLVAYFSHRGFEIRLSPPGEYANSLISLIGGLSEVSVLASVMAYRVLDALALKSTKKVAQRVIKELSLSGGLEEEVVRILRDADVVHELKKVPRRLSELREFGGTRELLALLERLSALRIVKRGFHVPCPKCTTATWYPLHAISESLSCPGCSATFLLPVEQQTGSGTEIIWEYTLNSLVNRVMDQDVLPSMLALYHELKVETALPFSVGLELVPNGAGEPKGEFDYLFIRNQDLFAGETKAGTELTEKDIATARLAAALGIREFGFCTPRSYSNASLKLVENLRAELATNNSAMTIKVMGGQELLGGVLPEK